MEDITMLTIQIRAICRRLYSGSIDVINREGVLNIYNNLINSENEYINALSIELQTAMIAAYGHHQTFEMIEDSKNQITKK